MFNKLLRSEASLQSEKINERINVLLELATRQDPPRNEDFLEMSVGLLNSAEPSDSRKAIAVLWLHDWKKNCYLLDRRCPSDAFAPDSALQNVYINEPLSENVNREDLGRRLVDTQECVTRLRLPDLAR